MKQLTTSEKIKKYLSKKMILGLTAIFLGVCIIFVCSIVQVALDPSRWGCAEFISDEIILVALTVLGEVCLIMIGQSFNQAQEVSKISIATCRFEESINNNIKGRIVAFDTWVKQRLEPSDLQAHYEAVLDSRGIHNKNYLELGDKELKMCMENVQKFPGYDVPFRQIDKKQYKLIKKIQRGKYEIAFVEPSTYRKLAKFDTDKTISEKMANQQKKKSMTIISSVISKSLIVLCTGLIFGALVPTGGTVEAGTAIMKLTVRLFCFATAGFVGFFVGQQINDIDAEYIEEKIDVHTRFISDKDFKEVTEEDIAKAEFAQRVKKENEEYMQQLEDKTIYLEQKKGD